MSHQTPTTEERDEGLRLLAVAVVAGLVAGLTRPLAGTVFADVGAVPVELHHATAGLSTLTLGLHLVYSVAFGAAFVALLAWVAPPELSDVPSHVVVLGVGYGVVLWLVNVAVGWPLVQAALGVGGHGVPHLHPGPLVVHATYGLVLGAVLAATWR